MALPQIDPDQILAKHRVLGLLTAAQRDALLRQMQRQTHAAGDILVRQGDLAHQLLLILHGTVELQDLDLGHAQHFQAGEWLGAGVTPVALQGACQVVAANAAEVLVWTAEVLEQLLLQRPDLLAFFPAVPAPLATVGPAATRNTQGIDQLLNLPLRQLAQRPPVTLPPDASILEAARLMRDEGVSSVLLAQQGRLLGLVTDRDLRNRVLAEDLDLRRPLTDIATRNPVTAEVRQTAFEALLLMTRHNIHHLPVMDGSTIAGMVSASDLSGQRRSSSVYMVSEIHRQSDIAGLVEISRQVKPLQLNLAAAQASAYTIGHIITSITDALTARLLQLAEREFGPAPVDYVWVAAGSQARSEQTAKSDQDNCLVLDDHYDASRHGAYFSALSRFVCDGLAACGYIHCPGEMMAMTDAWRQPRQRWAQYFRQWIDTPEPKALMLTSVFFDLRAIHGQAALLDGLRQEVLQKTRGNSLFLAHMVGNALKLRPPLGLFGQISLIRGGEHAGTVDLKHSGIAPIVDLARIYALAGGLAAVNTHDRLELAAQSGEVSAQSARDLRDALEFLARLRITHQMRQTGQGLALDNYLSLREISNFERSQLKDAFGVVQSLQSVLSQRYLKA